jgi:hypothetical protein
LKGFSFSRVRCSSGTAALLDLDHTSKKAIDLPFASASMQQVRKKLSVIRKCTAELADGDIKTGSEKTVATTKAKKPTTTKKTTKRKAPRTARKTARKTARTARQTGRKVARTARKTGRKVARVTRKTGRKVARAAKTARA